MLKMSEEQDVVLLAVNPPGNNFNSVYYIVSLDILRLFPLSYLNDIFTNGIPIGSFLTGKQVQDILSFKTASPREEQQLITASSSVENLCTNATSFTDPLDLSDKVFDDISLDYSADFSMRYLFESVGYLSSAPINSIYLAKGLTITTNIDVFVSLGMAFQEAVFKELYKNDLDCSTAADSDDYIHSWYHIKTEFLFLREDAELYLISNHRSNDGQADYLMSQCIESMLEVQSTGISWGLNETGCITPTLMLEFLQNSGYLSKEANWDLKCPAIGKKATFAMAIVPITNANPFHAESQVFSSEVCDGGDSDTSVEQFSDDEAIPRVVAQVTESHHAKSVQIAIEKREPFKCIWWQRMPIFERSLNGSGFRSSPTIKEKLQIGILWIRRTWQLEFSLLE